MIKECNMKIIHDIKNFDNFYIDYKNKKLIYISGNNPLSLIDIFFF